MSDNRPTTQTGPAPRRRRKALLRFLAVLVVLAALGVVGPLAYFSRTGAPVVAPQWLAERLERELNRRLTAGAIALDRIEFVVDRSLRPRLQLRNVTIADSRGVPVARVNEVRARLSPEGLFRGTATLTSVEVSGAEITVRRLADGNIDLSFGGGAGTTGSLATVLDGIDRAFAAPPLDTIGTITADQLSIALEDARSGRIWLVTEGRIVLTQNDDSLDMTVTADVFNGTEELATTVIGFRTEKGSPKAALTATFENAAAADIAAQSPALAFLSVLEAPISGALRAAIAADGELETIAGTLEVGAGALQPTADTPPIAFQSGRAYVAYDAIEQTLHFSNVSVRSEAASVTAEGTAWLQDFTGRWPNALVGQFALSDVSVQPAGVFAEPMRFAQGAIDFRLRLAPFLIEIGQVALQSGDQRFNGKGRVGAEEQGWQLGLDLTLNAIPLDRLVALWPVAVVPNTRDWISQNVQTGEIRDVTGALRIYPDREPAMSVSYVFSDAQVQPLKTLPPITGATGYGSLVGTTYTTVIESGSVTAPNGGLIDVAGSVFRVGDVTARPSRAEVSLRTDSSIAAALSLLDLPPFSFMSKAGLETDLAEGRALVTSEIAFDTVKVVAIEDVDYQVSGVLSGVRSDKLVKDRILSADRLELRADRAGVTIGGPGRIGDLPFNAVWSQLFGPENQGKSRIEGSLELSQAFLDEFRIALPPGSFTGAGVAQVGLDLVRDQPPRFTLLSDLNRVGLALPALGWSKPRNETGRLEVAGRLGDTPAIDRLEIRAAGLAASGVIDLTPSGGLSQAQFDKVTIGNWLDGPVTLTGRGEGVAPAVAMTGGSIDLRAANLGPGSGAEGGPLDLALNRLTVSEGIALTGFRGAFKAGRGMNGQFTAMVNGLKPIQGTVVPTSAGAAVRILADDAGGVLAAAGILSSARGGRLDLTLNPTGAEGVYSGRMDVANIRIVRAPAVTDLLAAISIVGLLDQLNSGGITLSELDADFRLGPKQVTLYKLAGVGPSIGVSLDGTYDLVSDRLEMQGVISPVYFLNGIGQLFSRRGEGLFGFSFRVTGPAEDPRVAVNPLSILTPGMFREIFRRPPPAEPATQ